MEMGSFIPLVFGRKGGMGENANFFSATQGTNVPEINGKSYASAISQLKTRISFEILRSVHKCVKGYRTPFQEDADFLEDFSVNTRNAEILKLVLACFLEQFQQTVYLLVGYRQLFLVDRVFYLGYLLSFMLHIVFIIVMTINGFLTNNR